MPVVIGILLAAALLRRCRRGCLPFWGTAALLGAEVLFLMWRARWARSVELSLLLAAVAFHNIPQGMATGLSFLMAQQGGGRQVFAAAVVLALGIGIQNLPEGSAVAIPIRRDGVGKRRAFCISAGAGVLEPLFGVGAAALGGSAGNVMPWLLSFAAGAMLYVIAEELIPEASGSRCGGNDRFGTLGVMAGFLLMMVLDVALG